jgi:DNA replication protein DnaC
MFRRELVETDLERMMVPRRYWGCTFDEITDDGTPNPQVVAEQYLAKIPDMVSKGVGLLLWGANGRGKTSMVVVIAKELRRRGFSVLFMESASLKRAVIEKDAFDETETIWDRALDVDALILDDFGKGVQDRTGFGARVVDELIRHRNARKKITFITTNMNQKQLSDEVKPSTMHSLKECVMPVRIVGPDRREEAKEEIFRMLTSEG